MERFNRGYDPNSWTSELSGSKSAASIDPIAVINAYQPRGSSSGRIAGYNENFNSASPSLWGDLVKGISGVPEGIRAVGPAVMVTCHDPVTVPALKQTAGVVLITAGAAYTGVGIITAPTLLDAISFGSIVVTDALTPLPSQTFPGFLITAGRELYP
jgi:hypothetical protein